MLDVYTHSSKIKNLDCFWWLIFLYHTYFIPLRLSSRGTWVASLSLQFKYQTQNRSFNSWPQLFPVCSSTTLFFPFLSWAAMIMFQSQIWIQGFLNMLCLFIIRSLHNIFSPPENLSFLFITWQTPTHPSKAHSSFQYLPPSGQSFSSVLPLPFY